MNNLNELKLYFWIKQNLLIRYPKLYNKNILENKILIYKQSINLKIEQIERKF